ncbi:MAG: TAXI family TRAP transporter solute-binding subunit [Deferribacterales bacterium]
MKKFFLFIAAALFAVSLVPTAFAKTFVTIGTGGVTGVYYPTGGAISRMVNKKSDVYDIKSTVESTGGSVYNVNAVIAGDLEFGISQSDIQYQAFKGLESWKDKGPQKKLRSVFSLHPEIVTIVATENSGIKKLADMKGKRINIGNPGSGQYINSEDVFDAAGLKFSDVKVEKAKAVESPALLQDERIDAFFYTVGHPNSNIKEATSGRIKVRFVPVEGAQADYLIKKFPYYVKTYINIKDYPTASGDGKNVPAVGVKATLVTSSDVPDKVVYAITKEVFDNFDEFKTLHPAFANLTKQEMLEGLTAPVHPGALKYYKEAGLDKYISSNLR